MRRRIAVAFALIACALAVTYVAGSDPSQVDDDRARALSGGADATVFDATANAFALPVPKLSAKQRRAFAVGNSFFNRNWVTAPASTTGRDGLGPTFNAQSCSSCHFKDGRGQPPTRQRIPELGLLLRLSVAGGDGRPQPVVLYGGQLQDRAVTGVPAEGRIRITHRPLRGRYGDGTRYTLSAPTYEIVGRAFGPLPKGVQIGPRVAPAVFGVGLLEAVSERAITDHADPADRDGDGISGRPNRVSDERSGARSHGLPRRDGRLRDERRDGTALGRFGWKANVSTVEQQNAGAFNGDIGITTPSSPRRIAPMGKAPVRPQSTEVAPRSTPASLTALRSTPARSRSRPAATSTTLAHGRASKASPAWAAQPVIAPNYRPPTVTSPH